jgi:hypothetical protein
MAESLSSAPPGGGVYSFLSRGMMEMMQHAHMMSNCQKFNISIVVFHLRGQR